jgi:hypothetical protein
MNIKRLRNTHRTLFTHFVEEETKDGEVIRRREKNTPYVAFRPWLREYAKSLNTNLAGKAARICR